MDYDIITIPECTEVFIKRAKKDYDAVVAITGEEGSSKSTCASNILIESLKNENIPEDKMIEIFLERTIFSPSKEKVETQMKETPRYSVLNADEAIKILYKLNWGSPIQKFLNMLYALARKENKITLLCMPRFTDFNEFFRKHRIKFWLHILDRGIGVLFAKDWNPFTDDPWWMKEGMDVVKKNYGRKKVTDMDTKEKIRILSKLRNFVGVVEFDDMPTKFRTAYRKAKDEFGYDDMGQDTTDIGAGKRAEKYQEWIRKAVIKMAKTTRPIDISRELDIPSTTIYRYLNESEPITIPTQTLTYNKQNKEISFD
ncbi:hypothetical protein C0585_00955 [Candidatus Woesearchaeota archaeon]|uniref:hypothetical protein n=1 Tax=uncultured Arcobacter sp. TaxID=165434 RepID=UPI000CA85ABE|nr:hypothetical protein [uncultured Arcobacter sp.]PLW80752.1 MAG: hypothetical protein C0585_00955 [Candidatus Woesearchaeota archaeon]